MMTRAAQIDTPEQWAKLKCEYDRNNAVPPERKTTRQHARWFKLRNILRCRWQTFTQAERARCVEAYGQPINPPGA